MEIEITAYNFTSRLIRSDTIDVKYNTKKDDSETITISPGSSIDFVQELNLEGEIEHSTNITITAEFKGLFFNGKAHIIVSSFNQDLYEEVALGDGESILLKLEPKYNLKLIKQTDGYTG